MKRTREFCHASKRGTGRDGEVADQQGLVILAHFAEPGVHHDGPSDSDSA